MSITSECFLRLNLSRPEGGYYISGSVEFLGRRNFEIGQMIQIGNLNFYIVNVIYKSETTDISIVSEGKRLQNLKLASGFKFITTNKGVLYYMNVQNIEIPLYTRLYINSSDSPWADTNHFDAIYILETILSALNTQHGTSYRLNANYSYRVKDLQINRGSDIISVIRTIYPFDARFMNFFVYNENIYLNLFPKGFVSMPVGACLVSFTGRTYENIGRLSVVGLAGKTGIWKVKKQTEDCSEWIAIQDSLTNKEYIYSKVEEVSLSGTTINITPKQDLMRNTSTCNGMLSEAKEDLNTQIKIKSDLETKDTDNVFDLLTQYALHFQIFMNFTDEKTLNYTKYETLQDFPPDIYEQGIVKKIETTQITKSQLLQNLLEEGKARRKRIVEYDYWVNGNVAVKLTETEEVLTDVIVIPNYSTEFYMDNKLGWNAGSKVRWIDLTNIQQTDIEDLLITLFFKQIKSPMDIFKLLSIDYKQYIRNLVDNDEITDMKNHTFVQEIISLNLPDQIAHFHQKVVNIIKRALKFLQDQYIPPVLAIYWADKDMNGFSKNNFEDSVNNNPYYQKLYQIVSKVNYDIKELVPIQKRIIEYRSLEGKKASKHILDISLSPTGFYRRNSRVEDVDYRSLITVVKPLSVGSVTIEGGDDGSGILRPSAESIMIPTNNRSTLNEIYERLQFHATLLSKRSETVVALSEIVSAYLPSLIDTLIFEASGFNISIDNKSGLSNISYVVYE